MVNGPRRFRTNYSLNSRHNGASMKDVRQARQFERASLVLMFRYQRNPNLRLRRIIVALLLFVRDVFGDRLVTNPVLVRRPRMLVDYSDSQLYHMRILRRAHVPRLIAVFGIPQVIVCPNRTVCMGEAAFLMFLYWWSMPRLLAQAQEFFGLEYSQISRIVKAVVVFLSSHWLHLIGDAFDYFAPRFGIYNAAIINKYSTINNGIMDPKYALTAMFTDGTQRQHNRNRRTNFSGHRRIYCYGFLADTFPDGMAAIDGGFAGRKNDHTKQNESRLSARLVACQVGNAIQYNTSTDKGFHIQPCVNPMFNNLINTVACDPVL